MRLGAGAALRGRVCGQNLQPHGIEGEPRRVHLRGHVRVGEAQDVDGLHAQGRQRLQARGAEVRQARHADLANGDTRHDAA